MSKPRTRNTFGKTQKCQIRTNVGSIGLGSGIGSPSPSGPPSPPPPLLLTFNALNSHTSPITLSDFGTSPASALVCCFYNGSKPIITDDTGNSYTELGSGVGSDSCAITYWYADYITPPNNVIISFGTPSNLEVSAFSVFLSRSAVVDDGPNFSTPAGIMPISCPPVTSAPTQDSVFAACIGMWNVTGNNKIADLGSLWNPPFNSLGSGSGNTSSGNQSFAFWNSLVDETGTTETPTLSGSVFNIDNVGALASSIVLRG